MAGPARIDLFFAVRPLRRPALGRDEIGRRGRTPWPRMGHPKSISRSPCPNQSQSETGTSLPRNQNPNRHPVGSRLFFLPFLPSDSSSSCRDTCCRASSRFSTTTPTYGEAWGCWPLRWPLPRNGDEEVVGPGPAAYRLMRIIGSPQCLGALSFAAITTASSRPHISHR